MSASAQRRPGDHGGAGASTRRSRAILAALLVIGAAVRLAGAWLFRNPDNPDQGIVALMAKHIAEGREFPVFFYGQAYMGSLEPAVSALLCLIFGYSGFAVTLGTAAVGFLLLPVVYVFARDIAGRTAGLAAVAFCIVGPVGYFHYMHSPRGGYALTLVLSMLLLWYGGRLAVRHDEGGATPFAGYALLGLIGGVGWWSNQLVTAAILATGLVMLATLGRRALGGPLVAASLGFAVGSLPFWAWNAGHDWASFAMAKTLGTANYLEALQTLLARRLPEIFNAGGEGQRAAARLGIAPPVAAFGGWFTAATLAGALGLLLVAYARLRPPARRSLPGVLTASLLLFVGTSIVLDSGSSYALANTPRYLLPLVPAFAVIAGVAAARTSGVLRGAVGFLPLALIVTWHAALVTKTFSDRLVTQQAVAEGARRLGANLRAAGVSVVYVPYVKHVLNALLEEQFVFCAVKGERYPPYAERAERSDEVAVLGDYGHVSDFVKSAGGSCEWGGGSGGWFVHRFRPPASSEREIAPDRWSSVTDAVRGGDFLRPVSDGDARTAWKAFPAAGGEPSVLEIAFAAPTEVSRVRLLSKARFPPKSRWEIRGRAGDRGTPWVTIADEAPVTEYYWSGPRPYFGGDFHRLEARFSATTVSAIRIVLHIEEPIPAEVTEVRAFSPAGAGTIPETQALPGLLEVLEARGVSRLYGDRWVANAVRRRPGNRVATPQEQGIHLMGTTVEHTVGLAPGTALLARVEDAGICRRTLAANGVAMTETAIGPWILFDRPTAPAGGEASPLVWTGQVCLSGASGREGSTLSR